MPSKQAARAAQKTSAKKDVVEEPTSVATGGFGMLIDLSKSLVIESSLVRNGPKVFRLLKTPGGPLSGDVGKKVEQPAEEKNDESTENDEAETNENQAAPADETSEIFCSLKSRLTWHKALGLGKPESGADTTTMWLNLKGSALDWGPRPSKRGTPKLDRIMTNLCNFLPQYLHILCFGFMLNCLVFRSFFACLPWLVVYQLASVMIPLATLEKVPQVPLSLVPLKFRVAGTMAVNALVWLFFVYEAIWRCNFFIEFLLVGLVIFHAYAVAPGSMQN